MSTLIETSHLSKEYKRGKKSGIKAVTDVSFALEEGETVGLAGESGCGKSTLARLLVRIIKPTSGTVTWRNKEISSLPEKEFMNYRRKMQFIFQDPYASLNPRMTIRDLIAEPLVTYRLFPDQEAVTERVKELLQAVGLDEDALYRYPHQFSGGQRQRIGIARALGPEPELLLCDEPVSALDISVQNQILNLLMRLKEEYHFSCLFISHDLSVVRHVSDRIFVMFLGKNCEMGPREEVLSSPLHPYTHFLIQAHPLPDPHQRDVKREILSGEIPSPSNLPSGCLFHTRCPFAKEVCAKEAPPMKSFGTRQVLCHFPLHSLNTEENPQ